MRSRRAVLGLGLSLGLTGCLGAVPFRPRAYDEAVRVEAVDVTFTREGSGALTLKLQVKNPSSDAATLVRVDFDLRVDGRRLATGEQVLGVPVDGDGEVPLEVRFPLAVARGGGRPEGGSHGVRVQGGVVLRFGGSERRAPFQDARSLDIAWLPGGESSPAP
ncbi:LEA type 2 family protein [Corallococcus sp. EGB]|uniref:LEA type 2 family protein n=1 Tax=Corallococcus sp. EGB TaxID=1521117 RepID=UPI001CBD4E78|nr:LEA type 2 family protein [Corallococcus sp. EGB]